MFDLVPPLAMAALNACVGVHLLRRRATTPIPHSLTVAACVLAPVIYGVGALLFLLLADAPAKRGGAPVGWFPGLALGGLGTFSIPLALALTTLSRPRTRVLLAIMAVASWVLVWSPRVASLPWDRRSSELLLALYVAVTTGLSVSALLTGRGSRGAGLERRLHMIATPLFALGFAYLLLKDHDTRTPVFSTSVLVAGELMLLVLVADHLEEEAPSTPKTLAFQVLLLALGALLLLIVAINLRLFPKQPGPVAVAVILSTGLSLAYGAFRPAFDVWLKNTLYPESQRAAARIEALQGELEATRERLRVTEHMSLVGQLAAEVAHEIKNPLGPIKGYAKIIERDLESRGALSDVVARGIAVIREEVETIDSRARSLLEAARPPAPSPEALDLGRAVDDVLDLLRADAPSVRLAWRVAPPAAPAELDRLLLRSALTNVVKNAVDALDGKPGAILVSITAAVDGVYQLAVEDDGPGLPADVVPEELFRPFVTRKRGGTGLGLVIARGAMRTMGGDLLLERRAPEPGARAILRVPMRAVQGAAPDLTASSVRAVVAAERKTSAETAAGGA